MRTVLAEGLPATADAPVVPAGRVLYLQYTNPAAYPPLVHSTELLAEAGFSVRLLGTAHSQDVRTFGRHERIRVDTMPFEAAGWRQKWHYLRFAAWSVSIARRWRPDWLYASDPLSCPIALILSWMTGIRVIYHEHDSPAPSGSGLARIVLKTRRAMAARSDVCVLPNETRAAEFSRVTGRRDVFTVWNCPLRREIVETPRASGSDPLCVFYHGSIVPARVPEAVVEALAMTPPSVSLTIAGYETLGHRGYAQHLLGTAERLGLADRVSVVATVPTREDLMRQCAAYDVGLALMPAAPSDANERTMAGASNKAFDYLACGLALLVSDLPDWRRTYVEPGYALACVPDSAESIAAALRWLLGHPDERRAMGERGRRKIADEWNYERTFAPVLRHMLAAHGPGAG